MMPTPEEIFIRDLKAYLINELEFTDTIERKINLLLKSYKESVEEKEIVENNFFVYKTSFGMEINPYSDKKILDKYTLAPEFDKFCEGLGVDSNLIRREVKGGRSKKEVTNVRINFCNYAAQNFIVNKSELANFFNLNHATIHYYFNQQGKNK